MPGRYVHLEAAHDTARNLRDGTVPPSFAIDPAHARVIGAHCHTGRNYLELGVVERVRPDRDKRRAHPFARPLGTRRVIEEVGPERFEQLGDLSDAGPGDALLEGIGRLWSLDGLDAQGLARALAEAGPFAHLLRFSHADPERQESGGYSLTVVG